MTRPTPSVQPLRALGAALLLAAPAAAQGVPAPAPPEVLAAFDVAEGWVQELVLPERADGPLEVELLVGGAERTLFLAPSSVRAPGFQLLVQDASGAVAPAEPAPPATVRGFLVGEPESLFAGSLRDGRLSGVLRVAAGEPFHGVQPLSEAVDGAPAAAHLIYDGADVLALPGRCGVDAVAPRSAPGGGAPAPDGGSGAQWIELACDADVQYFNKSGGSVTATQDDVESVINGVDAIYDADFDLRYEITTILVRTAEPDPYTTASPGALLDELKFEWLLNQADVQRDVTHLFTGKNLVGSTIGIAYLGGVCSSGSGYGLSQSKYTFSMTKRVALTAHELGHNWAANHCNGTGSCNIMCSWLGGCSGGLTSFGPAASAEIEAKKAVVTCLSGPPPTVPPTLTGVTPDAIPALGAPVLEVTGSELEWVSSVDFHGATYDAPAGFAIGDGVLYVNYADDPPAIGPATLTATNPVGTSNALDVTVADTHPPLLIAGPWALTSDDYAWEMGGGADDLWFLSVAVGDDTTVELFGYPLLAGGILVGSGPLGANGIETLAAPIQPSAVGVTFHSQLATFDGASGAFGGASAVKTAVVLL